MQVIISCQDLPGYLPQLVQSMQEVLCTVRVIDIHWRFQDYQTFISLTPQRLLRGMMTNPSIECATQRDSMLWNAPGTQTF